MTSILRLLPALLLASGVAAAGEIEVEQPWARASLGATPNSAAYMTIRSAAPDRLTGASSPAAGRVELHNTTDHAGVTRMQPVAGIDLGPGRPAVLQPGGLHLMLMDLQERLEEGGSIELELTFEEAGAMTVEVPIRGMRGGSGHGGGGTEHRGHMKDGGSGG